MIMLDDDILTQAYCNFCGSETGALSNTAGGMFICSRCEGPNGYCRHCGTVRDYIGQAASEQRHYTEHCEPTHITRLPS